MANSLFFNMQGGVRFPISLLALEVYAHKSIGLTQESEFLDLFAWIVNRYCGVSNPSDDDKTYFLNRLIAIHEESSEPSQGKAGVQKKSFGTSYQEYMSELALDSVILRMTGYNYEAARRIYCDLDRQDTFRLVKDYQAGIWQKGLLELEACMYGFGNSYSEDSKPSGPVHDLNTEEGMAALRSLGF